VEGLGTVSIFIQTLIVEDITEKRWMNEKPWKFIDRGESYGIAYYFV